LLIFYRAITIKPDLWKKVVKFHTVQHIQLHEIIYSKRSLQIENNVTQLLSAFSNLFTGFLAVPKIRSNDKR